MGFSQREYYLQHKEAILSRQREYYKKNKKWIREYVKEWQRINNPDNKRYRLSHTLNNIRYRCNNPKDRKYKYYGGKGIKCLLTKSDLEFLWFRDKAFLMKQPSIDRKDNTGNYTLGNCRFIEMEINRIRDASEYKHLSVNRISALLTEGPTPC